MSKRHGRLSRRRRIRKLEVLSPRVLLACTAGIGGGDYNANGTCDSGDIELLSAVVRSGTGSSFHDLNLDGLFNQEDRRIWIQVRANTWYGDADLNQSFDSGDLTTIEQAGEYEDRLVGNSTWREGDFTGDAEFDRRDLVAAFQAGGYNRGAYFGRGFSLPSPQTAPLVSDAVTPAAGEGESLISLVYDPRTGRLRLRSRNAALTSFSLESSGSRLRRTAEAEQLLSGAFDLAEPTTFLKVDAASFQYLDLGLALPAGLSEVQLLADLSVMGSLRGGGQLGTVRLEYLSLLDTDEPTNDTITGAVDLTSTDPIVIGRSLDHAGDEDWYRWTADRRGQLSIDLTATAVVGNAELELYNAAGQLVARSSTRTDNERLRYAVLAGETYFVRVYGYRNSRVSDYDLAAFLIPEAARVYVLTDRQIHVYRAADLEEDMAPVTLPIEVGDRVGDIEIGANGLVYVGVDPLNRDTGEILEFTPLGQLTRRFILPADPGPLQYPRGFDVLEDGSYLVAQPNARRIVQVDTEGLIRRTDATPSGSQFPVDATVTVDQVVVWSSAQVRRGDLPPATGFLLSPIPSGGDWVANPSQRQLQYRNSAGEILQSISVSGPLDVQEAADGSLFYVTSRSLVKLSNTPRPVTIDRQIEGVLALAVSDSEFAVRSPQVLRDRDGDGLLDEWEEHGLDVNGDGIVDLDLPALGADPDHKDLFVEVDAMSGHAPLPDTLDRVVQAFAAAPAELIFNPDGLPGVRLHLVDYANEYSVQSPDVTIAEQPFSGDPAEAWRQFHELKRQFLGNQSDRESANAENILNAKQQVFRYVLFADTQGTQGTAGAAEPLGWNVMLTLGDWSVPGGTSRQQSAVFMHYLGRMLGLEPGGQDDIPYKSNYLSVMNFAHADGGTVLNGMPFLDFSRYWPDARSAQYRNLPLDETRLDESTGLGFPPGVSFSFQLTANRFAESDQAVDWNESGGANDGEIDFDLNYVRAGEVHQSYNDWGDLNFSFEANLDPDQSVDDPVNGRLISDVCENFYPASDTDAFECNDDKENSFPLGSNDFDQELTIHESDDRDWFQIQAAVTGLFVLILDAAESDPGFVPPVDLEIMKDAGDGCVDVDVTPTENGTARQYEVQAEAGQTLFLNLFPVDETVNFTRYRLLIDAPEAAVSWTGDGVDNGWTTAGNWQGLMVPSPLVDVVFPLTDGNQAVNLQGDRQTGSITVASDYSFSGGTFEVVAPELSIASPAATVFDVAIQNAQPIEQLGGGSAWVNQTAGAWTVMEGRLGGIGTLASLTVGQQGTVAPGNSVGTLEVDDFALIFGSVSIEVQADPTGVPGFLADRLTVGNAVSLAAATSRLEVRFVGPSGATGEFSLPIIEAGSLIGGEFALMPSPNEHLGAGVFFHDVAYSGPVVDLLLYQAQAGDANGDGRFDSADLVQVLVAGKYDTGQADAGWTSGDWNGDGLFNSDDLILALQIGNYQTDAVPLATGDVAAALFHQPTRRSEKRPNLESKLATSVLSAEPPRTERCLDPQWVELAFNASWCVNATPSLERRSHDADTSGR